ncbi:uncharacterized protein M6B38_299260 [Iris pallida]|uniref:Uncharacterized protein n=1 Tax=Iris pallida TaxID=29817 RepID=A0AAX6DTF9_IRIPA|nr:Uncharacterized protein M6B38_228655 [Iris pallida]KAJ6842923.1 uncharacterized protein M6B38_299260 [Iris pallida]
MGRVVRRRRLPRVTEWTVYGRRLQIGRKTVAETGATMGATMGARWRSAHLGEGGGGETRSGGGERFGGLMVAARPDRRWRHRRGSADAEIRGRRLGEPSGGRGHGVRSGGQVGSAPASGLVGGWPLEEARSAGFRGGQCSTKRRCGGGIERWSAAPAALLCEGRRTLGEMRTGEGFPPFLFFFC